MPALPRTTPPRTVAAALAAAATVLTATSMAGLAPADAASVTQTYFTSAQKPRIPVTSGRSRIELGMKFSVRKPGRITSLRFYKGGRANAGTHVGTIWSSTGKRLARVTFASGTASGWQSARLATPLPVTTGRTYVVSYNAPVGHYSVSPRYFRAARTSGLIRTPKSAGVYRYGRTAFPKSSHRASNYWVDVVFTAQSTDTTTTPTTPTTTPTPTPAPAPTPGDPACSTSRVWQQLDSCGWPGPATTGYPDGQTFSKTVTGGLVVSTDNTVIDGYKVSGGIQVRARNVTIRNSWVTDNAGGASGSGVVNVNPGASATIENNLLDGLNATHTCIWHEGSSMTARGNECTHVNDGIFSWATNTGTDGTGDNFTIENNWLHAFTTQAANGHIDGYQTEGAKHGVIRHNTIDVSQDQNAAIAIWNGRKSSDDILVENNLLAGGGFNVYAEDYSPSETSPAGGYSVTDVRFVDNKFSNVHYGCVGHWGVWYTRGAPTDGWKRTGNVLLETNADLDSTNPSVNGSLCR